MSIFDKTTVPKKARTRESQAVAYIYAAILIVMVLCQLFNFDEFLALLESFGLPGGDIVSRIIGGFMVIAEVFALPFLISMRLNTWMRSVSMMLGWIVPVKWLVLALWLNLTVNDVTNIGFLGTTFRILPGWWAVSFCVALILITIWASWGLWPYKRQKRKSKSRSKK